MTLYVVVLTNRKTGRMTLMGCAGETLVFASYQEATFRAHEAFGADNPSVEHETVRIAGRSGGGLPRPRTH